MAIDAYFSLGDIPENIVSMIKKWYELLNIDKAEDFSELALAYGIETNMGG